MPNLPPRDISLILVRARPDRDASVKGGDGNLLRHRDRDRRDLGPIRFGNNHHGRRQLQERRRVDLSRRARGCRLAPGPIQVSTSKQALDTRVSGP